MAHSVTSFPDDSADARARIEYLLSALKDIDLQVRAQAAWTLGDGESRQPRILTALIKALKDDEGYVRAAASDALYKIGEPAVPALVEVLQSDEGCVWAALTLGILAERARAAIPALISALNDCDPRVRVEAAGALVKVQPEEPLPLETLIESLQCENGDARARASYHLRCLGARARSALPALISALRDEDRTVRENAAETIGVFGPAAVEAVAALITLLNNPHRQVRKNAAEALGRIGEGALSAVFHLEMATKDHDRSVRWKATKALAAIVGNQSADPGAGSPAGVIE